MQASLARAFFRKGVTGFGRASYSKIPTAAKDPSKGWSFAATGGEGAWERLSLFAYLADLVPEDLGTTRFLSLE
jgi:hypothetical protein